MKINLGEGAALPTRVNAIDLEDGEMYADAGVAYGGYAYYGTGWGSDPRIIKVAMGAGAALPSRLGALSPPFATGQETFDNGAGEG